MHSLGKAILEDEGFSEERYTYGYVMEANPDNELEVAHHTNKIVKGSDGRLAPVPVKRLFGCLAKNHLVLFLQALAHGKIRWGYDQSRLITMVKEDEALKRALDLGLDMWVLKWEAARDDPEGVQALIASDNLEALRSKADSEIDMLTLLHHNMEKLRGPISQTETELKQIVTKTGNIWSQSQANSLFNFMKCIGPIHFEMIKRFFFLMANSAKIRTPCSWFYDVHKLGNCPWAKVALIVAQYTCDAQFYGNRVNGVYLLKYIEGKKVLEMKDSEALTDLNEWVGQLVAKYAPEKLPEIDEGALTRALFSAMSKAVKDGWWKHNKVLIKRPKLMDGIYKKAEKNLRSKFSDDKLPRANFPSRRGRSPGR